MGVILKYFNTEGEDPEEVSKPEFTDRAIRKLVKLWSIDEVTLADDLAKVQANIDEENLKNTGFVAQQEAFVQLSYSLVGVLSKQEPILKFITNDDEVIDVTSLTRIIDQHAVIVKRRSNFDQESEPKFAIQKVA